MNTRRPWRRGGAASSPAAILSDLQARELVDLERCRSVWESGGDPLAVVAAVTKADLPEWLTDALLLLLVNGVGDGRPSRAMWRRREQRAVDAARAIEVCLARAHPDLPQTWEFSYLIAEMFLRKDKGTPRVGPSAMKRSFQRVSKGLSDPARYHRAPGLAARIGEALARVRARASK
jgi:hypothetical protein